MVKKDQHLRSEERIKETSQIFEVNKDPEGEPIVEVKVGEGMEGMRGRGQSRGRVGVRMDRDTDQGVVIHRSLIKTPITENIIYNKNLFSHFNFISHGASLNASLSHAEKISVTYKNNFISRKSK